MVSWCAVPGCTNDHAEHRFPTNKQRKRQWEIAIKREDGAKKGKVWVAKTTDRVCSKHFTENDYRTTTRRGEARPMFFFIFYLFIYFMFLEIFLTLLLAVTVEI